MQKTASLTRGLRAVAAQRLDGPSGCRRASIAAIFRESDDGDEQILFIRRALNPRDAWSGHVALPGGRQEPGDGSDEWTAMRETLEEVGLDLSGWTRLGRLADDRLIHPRGRPMVISIFGFAEGEPTHQGGQGGRAALRPQPTEVADAWWVDTRLIRADRLGWRHVTLEGLMGRRPRAYPLLRLLGCAAMRFAAIDLPPPATAAADAAARDPAAFQLWGLTLSFLSDVSRTALGQPLVGQGAPRGYERSFRAVGGPLGQLLLDVFFGAGAWRWRMGQLSDRLRSRGVLVALASGVGLTLVGSRLLGAV